MLSGLKVVEIQLCGIHHLPLTVGNASIATRESIWEAALSLGSRQYSGTAHSRKTGSESFMLGSLNAETKMGILVQVT